MSNAYTGDRNPFSVPEDQWDWDGNNFDLINSLVMGMEIIKMKCWAEAEAGLYDLASIAMSRLSSGRLVITRQIETCAVGAGGLFINPDFLRGLTPPQRNFINLHEASHVLYRHGPRFAGKNQDLANIAGDLSINDALRDWSKRIKLKSDKNPRWPFIDLFVPCDECLYPDNPDIALPPDLCAEDYYSELLKKWKKPDQQDNPGQEGFPGGPPQPGQGQGQPQQGQGQGQNQQNQQGGAQGGQTSKYDPNQQNQQGGSGSGSGQQNGQDQQQGGGSGDDQQGDDQQGDGEDANNGEPKEPELDQSKVDEQIEKAKKSGLIDSGTGASALDSQMADAEEDEIAKARAKGMQDIGDYEDSCPSVKGGLTKEQYEREIAAPGSKESAKGKAQMKNRKGVSATAGLAQRGVDGKVARADDEAMWWDILEPLQQEELTDKKRYSHREIGKVVIADAISDAIHTDTFLKGRVMGYAVGGEVLIILDTSGSTGDYWQLAVAKCLECLSAMEDHAVVLRVVLFSSGVSIENEYIFYNSDKVEEDELNTQSIIRLGMEVLTEHVVDVAPMIGSSFVDIKSMVGSKIVGGGGTELLPVVGAIEHTIGKDEVAERFLVTIIVTDAELMGADVTWATSNRVYETFGDHVCWLFLDLYGCDYKSFVGEKKYLIACR